MGQGLEAILARADASAELPRLGGMARPNGVVIVSERYWAFAGNDGSLREGAMPALPEWLHRIPLARGLARLGLSLAPLFRRSGVAGRRERPLLLAALIAPFLLFVLPDALADAGRPDRDDRPRRCGCSAAGRSGCTAPSTARSAPSRSATSSPPGKAGRYPTRFSRRCGTNFAALAMPVAWLADRFWPLAPELWTPVAVTAVALAATMEIWRFAQVEQLGFLLLPGLALQRLTTREPALDETRIALRAAASVLERELA